MNDAFPDISKIRYEVWHGAKLQKVTLREDGLRSIFEGGRTKGMTEKYDHLLDMLINLGSLRETEKGTGRLSRKVPGGLPTRSVAKTNHQPATRL